MTEFGYWLSCEEHEPLDLVRNAARAEELGFSFAMISDHFHPWIEAQGQSPFVWSVLGGIAHATKRIELATGVTCPLIRTHPAIVAQAAATVGAMLPGRFTLGLGTGENLNEHVTGARWPAPDERVEMLEEAIEVIRLLWHGGEQTHRGKHYTVDHATLYTLPEHPIPIAVAAAGRKRLSWQVARVTHSSPPSRTRKPSSSTATAAAMALGTDRSGSAGPRTRSEAKETVFRLWRHSGLGGTINQELPRPSDFDAVAQSVTVEMAVEDVPCGPDPEPVLDSIRSWERAGYDRIAIHQVGPDQTGFFRFWEERLRPELA